MSHSICYLIVGYEKTLSDVLSRSSLRAIELGQVEGYRYLSDCRFEGSDTWFLAEATDLAILLYLPYRYSLLHCASDELTWKLEHWESILFQYVGRSSVFRLDEYLVDGWLDAGHTDWLRSRSEIDAFKGWLEQQERAHWQVLQ